MERGQDAQSALDPGQASRSPLCGHSTSQLLWARSMDMWTCLHEQACSTQKHFCTHLEAASLKSRKTTPGSIRALRKWRLVLWALCDYPCDNVYDSVCDSVILYMIIR